MSDPKDFDAIYPSPRARPLSPEEQEAIKAQQEEAERQDRFLRGLYDKSQPPRVGETATKFSDLYPKSVNEHGMGDGDIPREAPSTEEPEGDGAA